MARVLGVLAATVCTTRAQSSCVVIRQEGSTQDIKFEVGVCAMLDACLRTECVSMQAYGNNAIRTRVVPSGSSFVDTPEIVSALVPFAPTSRVDGVACSVISVNSKDNTSLTVGNLHASVT